MRGTVGIHGATHGGMNSKQNQLEIFQFLVQGFLDLPKFSTEMLEMLKGSLEMLVGFLGHKLCVLDLFFLGLLAFMYWVREVFCVLITHYKDSISEWGQAFPYIFDIEIAFSTCGCLVSRRCPSQWMSYGAGHEKSFNRTTLSCQTNLFVTEFLQNEKKALAS